MLAFIIGLAACVPSGIGQIDPPTGFEQVSETWEIIAQKAQVGVKESFWLSPEVFSQVNGSPALDLQTIIQNLGQLGAQQTDCKNSDVQNGLTITCLYKLIPQDLDSQDKKILLPDFNLSAFILEDYPTQIAKGVIIRSHGSITVEGAVIAIPTSLALATENGLTIYRHSTLTAYNHLSVDSEAAVPPGDHLSVLLTDQQTVIFEPDYFPGSQSWIAIGICLVIILWLVSRAFPVRTWRNELPILWQPKITHLPGFLAWLVLRLAIFINWLRINWATIFNRSIAAAVIFAGLVHLAVAWELAGLGEHLQAVRQIFYQLPSLLPFSFSLDFIFWPGWPVLIAGLGMIWVVDGTGLLARQEFSRLFLCGMMLGVAFLVILVLPGYLVMPPLTPFYYEIVILTGLLTLISCLIVWRTLTHPNFRQFFRPIEGEQQ